MGYPKRVDQNQPGIVQALRMAGAVITDTHSLGDGYPDISATFRNEVFLLEIKLPKCQLTPDERIWHERNQAANIGIVHSPEEALRFVNAIE